MPEYKCQICNYKTNKTSNWDRHKLSRKHLNNESLISSYSDNFNPMCNRAATKMQPAKSNELTFGIKDTNENDYVCDYCGNQFSCRQTLSKHIKSRCRIKNDRDDQLEQATLKIEQLTKEKEKLFDLAKNNSQTANKSISAMSFLMKNCGNAPEMRRLEGKDTIKLIKQDKKSTHSTEKLLIHHFDKKILHEYIGDMIVAFYKKKNQSEQSVWTSDVSRLNFLICQLIDGTDNVEWIKDKSGVKLTSLVIEPVLDKIKEMLSEYIYVCHNMVSIETTTEMEKIIKNMNTINLIIMDINLKKLHKSILKYIAPKFNFDINKI